MKQKKRLFILFSSLVMALALVALPFISAQAQDTVPAPVDPQSWSLWRDMTWETWRPNPVIDWMTELNPAGLVKPAGIRGAGTAEIMKGGVVLIDYLDRKFISRQPQNSDPLGFTMYDPNGGGMVDTITNNPIASALELIAEEKYDGDASQVTDADFAKWWADYLNVPSEVNQYTTVDSYYRENSYGQWAVDLIGYGPFTLPYFEFETMGYDMGSNFQTYRDVPPSFRRGTASNTYTSFDSVAIQLARDTSRAQTGTTLFEDVDFFFLVHAGYDESGVWQQFGMFQFPTRQSIPYELGPGPRMAQVEKFFTENPEWLTTYATRYGSLADSGETVGVAAFWNGELEKYTALVADGKGDEYEFKLRQADWDWVNNYNNQTQRNTRYVAYTCWEAAVGEWSHMTSASATNTGVTGNRTIRYSTQGESDGRGTFAHEFGHIGQLPDNYQLQWTIDNSPLTEPWEVMSGGQIAGPFGEHTRWQVPGGSQGDSVPTNMTLRNKYVLGHYSANDLLNIPVQDLAASTPVVAEVVSRNIPLNNNGFYPQLDQYGLVSPNYYKGIRLEFVNNTTSDYRDKSTRIQTGWSWTYTARALSMGIEVVDQSGYDSYTPDHGVILTRNANESTGTNASYTWQVIDSHLYDIGLVDYMSEGLDGAEDDYVAYTIGSRAQLFDGAFHVGKSTVDTGYYGSIYDPADPHYNDANPRKLNSSTYDVEWKKAMLKPGSIMRWEEQDGRPVVSGDTVNEWYDPYNDLHIYILAKNWHDGRTLPGNSEPEQFLSYTIGVLHGEGQAVGGDLEVDLTAVEPESLGRVAVATFDITNTGDATDIIRVKADGMDAILLNDLYAIGAGETITVPVYVEITMDILTKDLAGQAVVFTASSESNDAKVASATVEAKDLVIPDFTIYLESEQSEVLAGDTLYVDVMLVGNANYTRAEAAIAFDSDLLEYAGYSDLAGWVGEVKKTDDAVSLQSVPNMNLYVGAPCATPVKLVRLKFIAKDDFAYDSIDTDLIIESVVVNPQLGAIGKTAAAGDPLTVTIRNPVKGALSGVNLITGQELEIVFDGPVLSEARAKATFDIRVDGVKVDWEYLSYFDFGPYAELGGVVNVRLKEALDAGEPRGRRRESSTEYFLAETQSVKGPVAAARITVAVGGGAPETAAWAPFYTERSIGNMSRMWVYGSRGAGNNGVQTELDNPTNYTSNNVFSATTEPLYTDEYITRQVAEGINRFVGRSEYLNLPMVDAGFKALMVGPEQSVYEVPEYRELYVYGETDDTYTRTAIKATEVPGNFDGDKTFVKPYIVGTSDDVMRYDSPLDINGEETLVSGEISARPRSDHFHFAEAFFDIYYHLGVKEGCTRFPLSYFNDPDDYRYDKHLTQAYEEALASGKWPGTDMIKSEKDYYVYGALVFYEMIPESQVFTAQTYPVNTRAEMYEYDYPLYWALSGIHGKYEYWTGTGAAQALNASNDTGKYNIPWFWHNQPDNFGLPAIASGNSGVPYEPLKIEQVTIVSENTVDVLFNREVKTVTQMATAANWIIYIDGAPVTGAITQPSGYNFQRIRLRTNCTVNFSTGAVTNAENRLDNGKPYGRYFAGFSQSDLDERSVANGGWIANDQTLGINSLEFGQFVGLDEAISKYGAGAAGKVEVEYIGPDFYDWDGNVFTANGAKYEAAFKPWIGNTYRTPLTGMYIYLDTATDEGHYNAEDVAMAAAQMYEAHLKNNKTIVYPTSAGGATFDTTFADSGTYTARSGSNGSSNVSWNNGTLTYGSQNITNGPVTYDRVGQRIADGAVRGNGGMIIAAASVLGHHPGMQPQSNGLSGNLSDSLRVEGWGGTTFQTEDVLVMRDYNLCRYKNESLVHHEGGHGIDSFTPAYAQNIYNDITSAWATATNPKNGARWADVSNIYAYCGVRGEYTSTLPTFFAGVMREQFQGINDATWTPICTREELFRYDNFGFEVFKRIFFIGELGLWYENKVGDPNYRVMPEDWELLRDTYPEFSHWTSVDNLIAWGASIPETTYYNQYTGQKNELSKWVSWKVPNVWDIEPFKVPDPSDPAQFTTNIYDFVGGSAYNPDPVVGSPTENQEHPFFRPGGVPKPVRPAELEALVEPISGVIPNEHATILSRPVLVEFGFENYNGVLTSNNVQTTFEMTVNGQPTHFYLWEFNEVEPGVATVTLRLDWPLESDAVVIVKALAAPIIIVDSDITVNFPGITGAEVRYYTNVCGWQTVGTFDNACGFEIPAEHMATWGATTVQVLKDGMWYTFSDLEVGDNPIVLDVPLAKIAVTGIDEACNLGLAQEDWVYRSAAAAAGETIEYLVFDNDKSYILHLNIPGSPTIQIPGIAAGATVDISAYF